MEETSLIARVRPYSRNISKRLIKAPKVVVTDPGLAASLAGVAASAAISEQFLGALLESYIFLNPYGKGITYGCKRDVFQDPGGAGKGKLILCLKKGEA